MKTTKKFETGGRAVVWRLKVPAEVWSAAKRSAVRRLESRLAEIVTQTLRLAAESPEDRA
jgi:hypothetical protein